MSDNEVTIHIKSKDETDLDKLGAKYKEHGKKLGDKLGEGLDESTKKAPPLTLPPIKPPPPIKIPATAENPIDAAWRANVEASLKATAKEALKIPVNPENEGFQRELSRMLDQASHTAHADIPMDIKEAAEFKRQVEFLAKSLSEEVKVRIPVEADKSALDEEKAKIEHTFSAMQFLGLTVGLPAAALVGAAGVGLALASVPVLFAGIGIAAVAGNAKVADSFGALSAKVATDTQKMAIPLQDTAVQISDKLGASFTRLEPQIQAAMGASTKEVLHLTDGVTKLAENAMPGLVTAVRTSEAPMQGLESLMSDVGAGASDMFVNMSKGAPAAGEGLKTTGGIVRDLEGFLGSLMANLANGSAGPLHQFQAALGGVEGVALSLTSHGMPALQSTTSSFLSVASGGLGVVKAVADGLGSWTRPLGSAAGSILATNSVAKLFGTSLGETGFGLKAFGTSLDENGNKTSPFRTAVAGAEGATGKLKAGLGAVVSNGINPLGLALIGGGLLLDQFGKAQEKAAEAAAAHRETVRTLTDAIRLDNGVMGEHVQAVNAQALTDKNASSNLATFGQTIDTASDAIKGNSKAYDSLKFSAGATLATIATAAGATDEQKAALIQLGRTSLETGQNYDQLKDKVLSTVVAYDDQGTALNQLTAGQQSQIEAVINATGAVGEQVKAQQAAVDAYLQAESGLSGLTKEQVKNRDATLSVTAAIYAQQDANLGYRGAVLASKDAVTNYNTVLKNSKSTDDQKQKALLGVEQAFSAQETAAYKAAEATSKGLSPNQKMADAAAAMDKETVKLANSMGKNLPASMQQTISKFSVAEAQAAGLTVELDKTGHAVYRLPNGKTIAISADTGQAIGALAYVQDRLNAIRDKQVSVTVQQRYAVTGGTGNAVAQSGRAVAYASGGLVEGLPRYDSGGMGFGAALDIRPGGLASGPGTGTSDDLFARVSNGEFVVKASQVKKNLPWLKAVNNGTWGFTGAMSQAPSGQRSVGVQQGAPATITLTINSGGAKLDDLLVELLSKAVRVRGGNVQVVLGK